MVVGVLTVELVIYEARSLKDKRRVLQSLKQRLRNRFNVSVAEVAHQDVWQRATLGVAVVSNEAREVESQLDRVVDVVRGTPQVSLLQYERELH
ncbi:MAG TPA: DUF503 domain-containing protein [Phycisphaerae bacterium]|nr:DUF503 domain-containing protein [Phycisphaerae bacterium]HNU45763.1 DUF503 domain-containing protein [Phycisphaerae bacterium]